MQVLLMSIVPTLLMFLDAAAQTPHMECAGGWQVKVARGEVSAVLTIEPPDIVTVTDEKYDSVAAFQGPAWRRGTPLAGTKAMECSVADALEKGSLAIRSDRGVSARTYVPGKDYQLEPQWACFGRVEGSSIATNQPVFASYRYVMRRLDSVVLTTNGALVVRKGTPHVAVPRPPDINLGEMRVGNIFLFGHMNRLTETNLFPVLETAYPEKSCADPAASAGRLIPRTLSKLQSGKTLRILAWGDSVTACGYLPLEQKWQEQFATRLRERFPKASIIMISEGWGGRTSTAFRKEPPGSVHNYAEKVLSLKPDLIISEFINDAYMNEASVLENYAAILKDFKAIGAEWIILTPHYARPDWMGLKQEREIDQDPRPYVRGLRLFAENNHVALADASLRWGRLWRQGLPYTTLLMNNINHPDERGMKLFADALMEVFGATGPR